MKKIVMGVLIMSVAAFCGWYLQAFRYYAGDSDSDRIEQSFRDLLDAWQRNDMDAVRGLCVSGFDPYAEAEISNFTFLMQNQSHIGRQVVQRMSNGDYAYQPNARRDWTAPFLHYFLGQVYFYRKEHDEWKFTGDTDYYVE